GVGALQQVDGAAAWQLLREQSQRAAGEQLHLDAIELRARRLDLRLMPLPLGGSRVENQAPRAGGRGVGAGLGDLERLAERIGRQGDGGAAGRAHEYRVLLE